MNVGLEAGRGEKNESELKSGTERPVAPFMERITD